MPRDYPTRERRPRARPRVEVVRRGATRRLSIDGTFASWYRPGQSSTGSVWDALAVPLLALPPERRRRVLILGLGGGSVARLLRALAPRAHIVAIEFDPEVVRAARDAFDLGALDLEVIVDDARAHLERERRRFDLVVDDVFVGQGRRVHKPAWLPEPGLPRAAQRVAPGGLLVSNALDEAPQVAACLGRLYPGRLSISVRGFDNRILVGGPSGLEARTLRRRAQDHPEQPESLGVLAFRTGRVGRPGARGVHRSG